jgi:AraC-like DNA-binding protein
VPRRATRHDDRGLRGGWRRFQQHWYLEPSPDVAPFVASYWAATWDLRGEPPYSQLIVPYPNVHLSFLNGVARVRGVARGHVVRVLDGEGWVFGVAFRPGCFRPFLHVSVSTLTDRSVAAAEVFGADVPEHAVATAADVHERAAIVDRYLRARLPAPDPAAETVVGIVDRVVVEPAITRVDRLADTTGVGMRTLQRLFAEYVGVGPKWVIRRYRIDEATKRMADGAPIDWAGLAAELGYTDQAHFTRDFTAMVGETPAQYAQRYPPA